MIDSVVEDTNIRRSQAMKAVNALFMQLRQVCLHPELVEANPRVLGVNCRLWIVVIKQCFQSSI